MIPTGEFLTAPPGSDPGGIRNRSGPARRCTRRALLASVLVTVVTIVLAPVAVRGTQSASQQTPEQWRTWLLYRGDELLLAASHVTGDPDLSGESLKLPPVLPHHLRDFVLIVPVELGQATLFLGSFPPGRVFRSGNDEPVRLLLVTIADANPLRAGT
jgi:hypothetical protein